MTDAFDFDMEARWELRAASRGVERYRRSALAADPTQLPAAQRFSRETVGPLKAKLEANAEFVRQAGYRSCKSEALRWLAEGDSELQAVCVVSTIATVLLTSQWQAGAYQDGLPSVATSRAARAITRNLVLCRENALWIAAETSVGPRGQKVKSELLKEFHRTYPEPTAADWREFRVDHDLVKLELPSALAIQIGAATVAWLVETASHLLRTKTVREGGRTTSILTLTEEAAEVLADVGARAEVAYPMLTPMIVPPNDWRYAGGKLEGGYSVLQTDGVRGSGVNHTRGIRQAISAQSLRALNAVQRTPWTVNRWLQDVAEECQAAGILVGDIEHRVPVAPKLSDEDWNAKTKEERTAYSSGRRRAIKHNASADGQMDLLLNTLAAARELREQAIIYYPHSMDFRGRIYPVPTFGPHPQGNDLARSLIMFAEGKPLGPDGLFWLYIRAANCAGQDKLPLEERARWVEERMGDIQACANAPLNDLWWTELDEPWGFLSTCHGMGLVEPDIE